MVKKRINVITIEIPDGFGNCSHVHVRKAIRALSKKVKDKNPILAFQLGIMADRVKTHLFEGQFKPVALKKIF